MYCTNYIPGLVPEFIAVLPVESMHLNESGRGYFYRSDGNSYKLINRGVEVNMVTDFGHEFAVALLQKEHVFLGFRLVLMPSTATELKIGNV